MYKCNCSYIPPHVLDTMARKGDQQTRQSVRASVQQAKISRGKRATRQVSMEALLAGVAAPAPGTAGREVYNCQNQWALRVLPLARAEGDAATGDDDVNDIYKYAGATRDYFQNELNRNSIDNQGMNLILNVHVGVDFMNAFWDGDEMAFGDGDGAIFVSFAKSLDVVAHELTHGVTQFTANLDYYGQSGALNEHFSDVFGSVITQDSLGQDAHSADWLVGNEIMGPTLYGEALRSMSSPGTAYDNPLMGKDPQPDHMNDYYAGPADNQGVHINSGIMNKVFYLVATDIGTPVAGKVWYHALQNLWPTASFNDAVDVLVESARVQVKNGVAPQGTTQTARAAFKEVGLPV